MDLLTTFDSIKKIAREAEIYEHINNPQMNKLLVLTYSFYHYFNANDNDIDAAHSGITFVNDNVKNSIHGIYIDTQEDDPTFVLIHSDYIYGGSSKSFESLKGIFYRMQEDYTNLSKKKNPEDQFCFRRIEDLYDHYDRKQDISLKFIYLTNVSLQNREKVDIRTELESIQSRIPNKRMLFDIVSGDELISEINDIEAPKPYVTEGRLSLKNNHEVLYFGDEKSFITSISALSLKKLFLSEKDNGLFAMNLRYYVKSTRIDESIVNTITDKGDMFWYLNNGLIIVCDDYSFFNRDLLLKNFSIVNGCQTTNMIGLTDFTNDFFLLCKVIKNKFDNAIDKDDFVSNIAEASNTQKPIKARDLIANRVEQKALKRLFSSAGIFMQVKRGDRINKSIYSLPWQNTTNTEVAQLLYSFLYMHPGIARNNASRLFDDPKIYDELFKVNYDKEFLRDLIQLRIYIRNWMRINTKSKIAKNNSPEKISLIKNSFFFIFSLVGLTLKFYFNNKLIQIFKQQIDDENMIKFYLSQPDINHRLFRNRDKSEEERVYKLLDYLYLKYLEPAYNAKKGEEKKNDYSNFTKTDNNFWKYVIVPFISDRYVEGYVSPAFHVGSSLYSLSETEPFLIEDYFITSYKPGLFEELKSFQSKTARTLKIRQADVITDHEIRSIMHKLPLSTIELYKIPHLSEKRILRFGNDIISIVQKYGQN